MNVQKLSCEKANTYCQNYSKLYKINVLSLPFHFLTKFPVRIDPHETCQTDQFDPKLFQHTVNGSIKLSSAPVQFVVYNLFKKKALIAEVLVRYKYKFCIQVNGVCYPGLDASQ